MRNEGGRKIKSGRGGAERPGRRPRGESRFPFPETPRRSRRAGGGGNEWRTGVSTVNRMFSKCNEGVEKKLDAIARVA